MSDVATEIGLQNWRYGSTQAERLAASILRLEQYQNVEPQAPLGGPDGGADILCDRGGRLWVAAVFFPPTAQTSKGVEDKFRHDLGRAKSRGRHGIVFITNQRLVRSERSNLVDIALREQQECTIFDVERIRGVLDSTDGYGIRAAYLGITMSQEEQIAYFASRENVLEGVITKSSEYMQALAVQMANLQEGQRHVAHTVDAITKSQGIKVEPLRSFDPLVTGEIAADPGISRVLEEMTPATILFVHRLVCFELPSRVIGRFRDHNVFIQKATSAPGEPTISPPNFEHVPALMNELCEDWRKQYIQKQDVETHLGMIAMFFHRFMAIHPFLDGNGRVARSLLMQQCIEFFGYVDMSRFSRGIEYYSALQAADGGNIEPLKELVGEAIAG